MIKNITGVEKNDQTLVKHTPAIYESIQTELNNYLQQPDWLNETTINQLEDITTNLDKIYYSNDKARRILLLNSGPLVEEIRSHFVDNTLNRPNKRLSDVKFGYMYVVGSDQFAALSNFLNIYEKRLKFASIVIELDSQSNIKVYLYDSKTGKLEDKSFKCEEEPAKQCKMIPFLKRLDKLIPVNYDRACRLPRVKTIEPDYDKIFKNKLNQDDTDDLNDDDLDLGKKERTERRKENIKKFIEKELGKTLEKNKELISWLSDLFERKTEIRRQENNLDEYDLEDGIKARFVEVLRERISKVNSHKENEQLNELLTKWAERKPLQSNNVNDKNSMIETVENRIKSSIRDKELIREQQRVQLIKLVDKIKQFNKLNSLQRLEKADNLKKQIDQTIKDAKIKFSEKVDDLKSDVQNLLEDKFDQISNNFNKSKLKFVLNEVETRFSDEIEERKAQRELELSKIKDRMIKLVDDNYLVESDKVAKLNEIKDLVSNNLDKEDKMNNLKDLNPAYSTLSSLMQEIPNSNGFEFETVDEETNNEQIKIEKIKDKLKIIERDIMDYLEINKENKKEILDSLVKFNDLIQSNKKVSIGLLNRLARLVNDEEIKEEIKEIIAEIIKFAKTSNRNLLDVESDLTTLIAEVEASNLKASDDKFNLNNYQSNLNISKPSKLLRASNPSEDVSSAFNPKGELIFKLNIFFLNNFS